MIQRTWCGYPQFIGRRAQRCRGRRSASASEPEGYGYAKSGLTHPKTLERLYVDYFLYFFIISIP